MLRLVPVSRTPGVKAELLHPLHDSPVLVLPNAWDPGECRAAAADHGPDPGGGRPEAEIGPIPRADVTKGTTMNDQVQSNHMWCNGLRVHYEDHGAGAPVVLLHGGLVTGHLMWSNHVPALARHHRVLVPDSRGHGRTDNPEGRLGYDLMADDCAAFIEALGLDRVPGCRPRLPGPPQRGDTTLDRHPLPDPGTGTRRPIVTTTAAPPHLCSARQLRDLVPRAVTALSGFCRRVFAVRDNGRCRLRYGVSALRHEPFGYQRLTTTLAL
jgi:hypothetical protein